MAARKPRWTEANFWESKHHLPASKVLRILAAIGADPKKFQSAFVADQSRGPRAPAEPTPEQVKAVAAFDRSGNTEALMKALKVKTPLTAFRVVARVKKHRR